MSRVLNGPPLIGAVSPVSTNGSGRSGAPEGTVVVTYALGKVGKTADALYSCPTAHFFTTAPRQLEAWRVLTGVQPREHRIDRLKGVGQQIRKLAKPGSVFVFDDMSIAAKREELALVKDHKTGWTLWRYMNRYMSDIREASIETQSILWFIFHEKGPKYMDETVLDGPPTLGTNGLIVLPQGSKKGVLKTQGHPKMPSEEMSKEMPYISPLVMRGVKRSTSVGGWKGHYFCDPEDPEWVTGDRWCVVPKYAPMNVREIMFAAREAGHDVVLPPRAPGLEWLDEAAEWVAGGLSGGQLPTEDSAGRALTRALAGRDPKHLKWAWRDGCARTVLRKGTDLFRLFTPPPSAGTGLHAPG